MSQWAGKPNLPEGALLSEDNLRVEHSSVFVFNDLKARSVGETERERERGGGVVSQFEKMSRGERVKSITQQGSGEYVGVCCVHVTQRTITRSLKIQIQCQAQLGSVRYEVEEDEGSEEDMSVVDEEAEEMEDFSADGLDPQWVRERERERLLNSKRERQHSPLTRLLCWPVLLILSSFMIPSLINPTNLLH